MIVTPEDYVLGMSDLTGELMRYATNGTCQLVVAGPLLEGQLTLLALSTGDHETPLAVCDFVRVVKTREYVVLFLRAQLTVYRL